MSKKESEFDRFDRMKRLEKETEVQKRKSEGALSETVEKKGGKPKANLRKNWTHEYADDLETEYDYV